MSFFLESCNPAYKPFTSEERKEIDNTIKKIRTENELQTLLDSLRNDQSVQLQKVDRLTNLREMVVLRQLGKIQRNKSHFDEALATYNKGLQLAESSGDTIESIQALNNIGTCYRRLGFLDVAVDYHYRAWRMSEEKVKSDTSFTMRKSRVVSLNGLGNIYLTQGNYERADSAFRIALKGESELNSHLGQAINYANLGAIYQHWEQYDSAWVHFCRSMHHNVLAKSKLGIALCHVNYGSMHETEGDYERASQELQIAYEQMKELKDEWHALSPLLSLVDLTFEMKDYVQSEEYLKQAFQIATKIQSNEHLAAIHYNYYRLYAQKGDYKKALDAHVKYTAYQNGVVDMEKLNKTQNTSLTIERIRKEQEISLARRLYNEEKDLRSNSIIVFAFLLFLCAIVVYLLLYSGRVKAKSHRILKKQSEMREAFFTNVTHEFRTPLTLILGLSRSIGGNKELADDVRDMAKVIERQGDSLLRLINELLYISKVKSEIGNPDWCRGNVAAYIRMIVENFSTYAAEKKIILNYVSEDIFMDFIPDYMNKAMNNLLFNAFKYTSAYGTIEIRLRAEKEKVYLSVSDTGEGIPSEELPHLFEPFIQGKNKKSGSGVGLALVHQIVESVHGAIKVKSKEGEGTTFLITFPLRQKNAHLSPRELTGDAEIDKCQQIVKQEVEEQLRTEEQMTAALVESDLYSEESEMHERILIVEDNHDVAQYIGSQLNNRYSLAYAPNGRKGLEIAREMIPDLIITDLMMPELDGLEMCKQIRADELISHVPVIVITAKVTDNDRIKGLEAGADAYLNKPFNEDELQVRVEKLLEQRRLLREKYSQALSEDKEDEVKEETLTSTDANFLNKVTDGVHLLMKQKEVTVTAIASNLCMSTRQFQRKITAITGETPSAYIMQLRIKQAKKLMTSGGDMNITQVAEECGFEDASNFSRTFKKHCGMTPTQFMNEENA